VALLIDGVHFAEHVVLAAVGIDVDGAKHPLGPREGATENAAACKALLEDLIERGLDPNRAILVVIDGAKALRRAVLDTFGERAPVQRCHAHKKRNVTDSLPERMRASVRAR
jgi:transposase-like protein